MGAVWAARHLQLDNVVAIKCIDPEMAGSSDIRARFEREAKASALMRSPHVVQVFDYGIEDDVPYRVIEMLSGEDLDGRLEHAQRMGAADMAVLFSQLCRGLSHAHEAGIVHRDLKPGNIFLATAPVKRVMVLDFGLAKRTSPALVEDTGTVSRDGVLLGTPAYSSPEQVFGDADLDHRTDVWSLGIILYETLSGVLPTEASTVGQVLKRIVMEPIPPLAGAGPTLPPDLCDLVGRMLSQIRGGRPKSLHEVAAVLARHAGVEPPTFGPPVRPSLFEEEDPG
jgi:eukaryotic-like serine/threonine-protein kinase